MPVTILQRCSHFENYWTFEAFDAELTRQLGTGYWVAVRLTADSSLLSWASAYYQPRGSQQVWVLSEPDNAWRGYFLPLEEALVHEAALRGADQRARLGCLLAVGLLGALVMWALLG